MHTWRMLGSKLTRRIGLNRKSLFCRWWRSCKNEPLSWSTGGSDLPMNKPTLLPLQISDRGSTPVSLVCPFKGCNPPLDDHVHTFSKTRSTCKYCSFWNLRSKQLYPQQAPLKVSNVYRMCVKCNVHLCEAHFQVYHTKNYESSDDEDEVVENFESV